MIPEHAVLEWLDARRPAPPPALAARLRAALDAAPREGGAPASPAGAIADRCLAAGERLLDSLLARGCGSRDAALDLLTADALVTYAFEAASESPAGMEERAREAMRRLGAVAAAGARHRTAGGRT